MTKDNPPPQQPLIAPNVLLDDIESKTQAPLELAARLLKASLLTRDEAKKLSPAEVMQSNIRNAAITTEPEANFILGALSLTRQRLAERSSTAAAIGASHALAMQRMAGRDSPETRAVVERLRRNADAGWAPRTQHITAPAGMEVEAGFFALRRHVGLSFRHGVLPTFNEAGEIYTERVFLEHVPVLLVRWPHASTAQAMCDALFYGLQHALGNKNWIREYHRMQRVGPALYIRGRLDAAHVSLLVLMKFTSAHQQPTLSDALNLLSDLASDGITLRLTATAAVLQLQDDATFTTLFPQAAEEVVGFHPHNFANINKVYWYLMEREDPMPDRLIEIPARVGGLRGPMRAVWLGVHRRIYQDGESPEKVAADLDAIVEEACAGQHARVLDALGNLDALTADECEDLIDYLPSAVVGWKLFGGPDPRLKPQSEEEA